MTTKWVEEARSGIEIQCDEKKWYENLSYIVAKEVLVDVYKKDMHVLTSTWSYSLPICEKLNKKNLLYPSISLYHLPPSYYVMFIVYHKNSCFFFHSGCVLQVSPAFETCSKCIYYSKALEGTTFQNYEFCVWWNDLVQWFKFCFILGYEKI